MWRTTLFPTSRGQHTRTANSYRSAATHWWRGPGDVLLHFRLTSCVGVWLVAVEAVPEHARLKDDLVISRSNIPPQSCAEATSCHLRSGPQRWARRHPAVTHPAVTHPAASTCWSVRACRAWMMDFLYDLLQCLVALAAIALIGVSTNSTCHDLSVEPCV